VLPGQICSVGNDEDRPVGSGEIAPHSGLRVTQSKDPHRAEGDRDDRRSRQHVLGAIVVRADVMAETAVVPVQEQAIEPMVDGPSSPRRDGLEHCGHGISLVHPTCVVVVASEGLLPARRWDKPSVDLNLVVVDFSSAVNTMVARPDPLNSLNRNEGRQREMTIIRKVR
jgi:hypothetical protein